MDKELKAKWVKALRSGEYVQGRTSLRYGGKHCCLGVLCELSPPTPPAGERHWSNYCMTPFYEGWEGSAVSPDQAGDLAHMNDEGKSFAEIADYIEANL